MQIYLVQGADGPQIFTTRSAAFVYRRLGHGKKFELVTVLTERLFVIFHTHYTSALVGTAHILFVGTVLSLDAYRTVETYNYQVYRCILCIISTVSKPSTRPSAADINIETLGMMPGAE